MSFRAFILARVVKRILAGVFVLLFASACVGLGLWQLERHRQKRAHNATIESRSSLAPAPLTSLASIQDTAVERLRFRRAVVQGSYDTAREIIITNRPLRGIAGDHVVTPLVVAPGEAVLVDRGWIPLRLSEPPVAQASPASGTVRVSGYVFPTEVRGRFGPTLPPSGELRQAFRIEIPRLQPQFPYKLYPVFIQLASEEPAQLGELPKRVPLPRLEAGPHLGYAAQWFLFATVAIAGYVVLLLRRSGRTKTPSPPPYACLA